MKVLHLSSGNLYGGVERMLVTLAKYRASVPEMIPEFGLCFRGRLWDELTATGVPVHDLGAVRVSRPWTVWKARRKAAALLPKFDVAITHMNWPHAVFAPAANRVGVPVIKKLTGVRRNERDCPNEDQLIDKVELFRSETAPTG